MTKKSIDWFLERIQKRIYRDDSGCDCNVCKSVLRNGLIIHDEFHARYLYDCQLELGLHYYDKKEKNE